MAKKSRTRNSVINASTSIVTQLLLTMLKFVCRTVFIQTLGKQYLGINGLFSDILTMLSLTELGLDTAINFKLYKPLADGDENRVRLLMKFYRYAYLVVGIVIFSLGVLLIPALPYLIKDYNTLYELGVNPIVIFLLFLTQTTTSYLFFASRSALLKADQQEYILSIVGFISQTILNVIQIITLLVWKDFVLYTALAIVFSVFANFTCAIIAKRKYPRYFSYTRENISKQEIRDIFKDLGALFIYKVNGVVLKATDNLVLSFFIGLSIVGIYSNYLLIYSIIETFLRKFYSAVKASMGNLFAKASIEKKYAFFETMDFLTILLYGTACVGIAVVADEMLTVWIGNEYVIPQPFAVLVGIEILFVGLKQNLGQIRNVSGVFRQMWYRPLLGIVINIVVSIIAVQFIGIYGVILGTIISDFSTDFMIDPSIIHKYSFGGYKPVSEYYVRNGKYILVLVLSGFADYMLCSVAFINHGWVSVIVHAMICGVTVPLVMGVCFHKCHECQYIYGLVSSTVASIKNKICRRN